MTYNEDGTVTYTKEEHEEAVKDMKWLCALENAGVDNWCGYDYAKELLQEDE